MEQILNAIKTYINPLFCILLFVVNPLVYSTKTVDINFAPQFYFFGITCLVYLILNLVAYRKATLKIQFNLLSLLLISYFIITMISVVLASYQQEGILEVYKVGGWLILIFVLQKELSDEAKAKSNLLKSIIIGGFILSFIGLMQLTHLAFVSIPGNVIPYGTLGNRNIYIPAILILLPFVIYNVFYAIDLKWKYFSALTALLILTVVLWSLMRTALLAIAIVMMVNLIILLLNFPKIKVFFKTYKYARLLLSTFLLLLFVGVGTSYFKKLKLRNDKKSVIFNLNSTNERAVLWDHSVKMLIDNPLIGVGAGNWKIILPKYGLTGLPPEARRAEMFFIRPENDFLWVFAETGIFGGICYFGIFIFVLVTCINKITRTTNIEERNYAIVVLSAMLLYSVTAFFGFPKDRTYLQIEFALIIALSLILYNENAKENKVIKLPFFLLIMCFVLFAFKGSQLFAAEKKLSRLMDARKNNQHDLVLSYSESIIHRNYLMDQTSTPIYFYEGVAWFSKQNIDNAIASFHKAASSHPYHLHIINNLATCYSIKGENNQAISYLNKALKISPDFQEAIINLSGLHYNLRNYKEAYKYFFLARTDNKHNQLYVNLDAIISKTINDSLMKLTNEYIELGDFDKAEVILNACLHKNKWPKYAEMKLAILRKRQQLNSVNK